MKRTNYRLMRGVATAAALSILVACGLPRSGPNKSEIFSGSVLKEGDAFVLAVDDRVNQIAGVTPSLGFSSAFVGAGLSNTDTIRPGDVLGLTVWENVDNGLLVGNGLNDATINEVQVDANGDIFVPYAGAIHAAGKSATQVRQIIADFLAQQTPDPQVIVRRLAGDGASVSVAGSVGAQGVYPIDQSTRTLAAMLAHAGGVTVRPDIAKITVVRGNQTGVAWFKDLYDNPAMDIALRGGDKVMVERDTRTFTALGATGTQNRVAFESQTITAIEAIAQVGGLSSNMADPTGVFVLRNEPEEIARQLVGDNTLIGTQRMIYVLDLTQPNGMFMARDFAIRDGDTVYVTEAPFVQFNKTIAAITGTLTQVGAGAAAATGISP